ncbi:MAG: 2-C-methyl-D-erythritol 2,4-cyclodiphosphate synthase [Actinomycetota bacterium]
MTAKSSIPRVGWGFDAHRLDDQPPLKLGGVVVSETQGVTATSDGDLVAHAVTDALLGACVLGDIGEHFPSDDPKWAGADSMELLRLSIDKANGAGWKPSHIDVTVIAESVRVSPHRNEITASLADAARISADAVSVKATSTDGLGVIGQDEGIVAVAVVTVIPSA